MPALVMHLRRCSAGALPDSCTQLHAFPKPGTPNPVSHKMHMYDAVWRIRAPRVRAYIRMSACVCRFVHLTFEASLPGRPAPEDGASASASAAVADSKTNRLP